MTDVYMGSVQQQSRGIASDGTTAGVHRNRSGQIEVNTIHGIYDYAVRAGKVFTAGPDTFAATSTIEQNASLDMTEPFIRATVPASKVVIPVACLIQPITVWTTADAVVGFLSDTNTYNTGGDVAIKLPMFVSPGGTESPLSTSIEQVFDGDAALTESTITNGRFFHSAVYMTGGLYLPYEYNALKGDAYPVIHGPASFGWAVKLGAAGAEAYWTLIYIELDKNEVSNA